MKTGRPNLEFGATRLLLWWPQSEWLYGPLMAVGDRYILNRLVTGEGVNAQKVDPFVWVSAFLRLCQMENHGTEIPRY